MSRRKRRITKKLNEVGAAWVMQSGKYCHANDPLENCAEGRHTYHVHPVASEPYQSDVVRFDTLAEIEEWIAGDRES